ncbi:hypothetical protein EHQ30_02380 [Leptospira brenneri]|uniref:Lipoprotein n=1 Tax=Leptospira brenneri TaxID=2023182 RepID=A0A5F1Z7R2_9LEPT|nr:hypothetical protein [Leptospira brenneri]TGK95506.1 hypothetical protein EHQ30_02380 [Leptospira brenneri]
MKPMRKILIVYSLSLGMAFGCKPAELSNTCDAKTKEYFQASIIRFITGDRSPSCLPSFDFQDLWGVYMPTPPSVATTVNAITSYNDQIIIGGSFQFVGPPTGNVVYLETKNGKVLPNRYCPYLKVVGTTGIAISDGSGGFYIGGEFYAVQGEERFSVAHILPGCQLDRNFNVLKDNTRNIYTLLLMGDSLYVGGIFSDWGGDTSQKFLVRLNRYTGALDTSFTSGADNLVSDLETDGESLYVCGEFANIGGVTKRALAKISPSNGSNISSFNNPVISSGTCLDLHYGTYANGSSILYAVGDFVSTYTRAMAFYPDGTPITWNPAPNDKVNSIQQYNNTIYLGGDFTTINGGTSASNLVSVNNSNGTAIATNYNVIASATGNSVATLQIIENTLYVTGDFSSIKSVPRNYAAALSLPDESVTAFDPAYDSNISNPGSGIVSAGNGVVLVTSNRSTVNAVPRSNFAVLDEVTGAPIEGTPNFDYPIKTLHVHGNRLFAGGSFTNVGGQTRHGFAILDLPHYNLNPTNISLTNGNEIRTITSDESQLYVGGYGFTTANALPRNGAFALNLSDLTVNSWNPNLGTGGSGENFLIVKDLVFLGGGYSEINGVAGYNNYQAVDKIGGTRRNIPSSTSFPGGIIYSQTLIGTKIYIGGFFTSITGIGTFNRFAAYDLTSQTYVQPNPVDADNMVNHVAAYPDGNVLIGGSFTGLNGATDNYSFGVFNNNTNTLSSWNGGINSAVYTSMYKNGKYYLGGEFAIALRRSNGGLVRTSLNE